MAAHSHLSRRRISNRLQKVHPPRRKETAAMSSPHTPKQNHLLDALPASDFDRIHGHLELVPMALGDVLYESGAKLRYVYFPTTSHRFAAVRDGGWRVGRNRHRGQRGHARHIAVHGRRHHAQPRRGAKRGARLSGSRPTCSRMSSGVSVRRCISCCATRRR